MGRRRRSRGKDQPWERAVIGAIGPFVPSVLILWFIAKYAVVGETLVALMVAAAGFFLFGALRSRWDKQTVRERLRATLRPDGADEESAQKGAERADEGNAFARWGMCARCAGMRLGYGVVFVLLIPVAFGFVTLPSTRAGPAVGFVCIAAGVLTGIILPIRHGWRKRLLPNEPTTTWSSFGYGILSGGVGTALIIVGILVLIR